MNIAVIFGGISPERNVSIAGGKAVMNALKELGHNVIGIDPAYGADGLRNISDIEIPEFPPTFDELKQFSTRKLIECVNSELFDDIDLAFLVLHGQYGECGRFQSLMELRGIPYTGSKVKASSVAIDKLSSKLLFSASGIPTPPWITVRPENYENYDYIKEIREELGEDIVIKPNDQGSTIGISIIEGGNLDDIYNAIKLASQYSEIVLAEQFIEGREMTVGIVGEEALPVIEIVPEDGFYDYAHKYTKGQTEYICPAEIGEDSSDFLRNAAYTAFRVLGCSGFGRADFRMDDEGQIYCLEVNTIPGFTATSLVPMAAKELGIEFPELCQMIIDITLGIENTEEEVEE